MEKNANKLYGPDLEGSKLVSPWLHGEGLQKPKVQIVNYGTQLGGKHTGYGYLIQATRQLLQSEEKANLALHCCSPFGVFSQRNKTNVLSSMWESKDLPIPAVNRFRTMDAIFTPSKWCTKVFKEIADCPVHTVPLWVDPTAWPYHERTLPEEGKKFRWLWLASADPRKGWPIVGKMWQERFANNPNVELYMKTSSDSGKELDVVNHGNTIIDRRFLPRDELQELYNSAHGFLYPSSGEGFGWTCAEALSTGLPVVGTSVTGHKDFFDERYGYVVSTKGGVVPGDEPTTGGYEGFHIYVPSSESMGERMNQVMNSYDKALKRAKAGSANIQQNFTFEKYVDGLYSVLEKYK
jgi:glycosyltransferase involved in cell wall biosynthesis